MTSSILIIEHHEDHRALLESTLRDENVTIESVDTGEAALLRLGMSNFGCVVLGSPVPVTFGSESSTILDLFDLLAPNLASRLVIVTSARAAEIVRRALKMQVHAVFLAPFDAAELRDVVRMCRRSEVPPRRLYGTPADIEQLVTQDAGET
ncbi:MAG TPA: response regulator [Thermoanaerobaculia bacterium]|nr:response regulator [Thermoanaerobaculia bacterium]